MKEIEDNTKNWKEILYSWFGGKNIVKMSLLPKTIYTFITIPIKIPTAFFTELEQAILNLYGTTKDPR